MKIYYTILATIFLTILPISLYSWSWPRLFISQKTTRDKRAYRLTPQQHNLVILAYEGSITLEQSAHKDNLLTITSTKRGDEKVLPKIAMSGTINETTITLQTTLTTPHPDVTINYTITVPKQISSVSITSHSGPITMHNMHATIDIATDEGTITLINNHRGITATTRKGKIYVEQETIEQASLNLSAQNGSIKLQLPKNVDAPLHAQTLKGTVSCSIPVTIDASQTPMPLTKESWVKMMRNVHGRLGTGDGSPITLYAKGNITIMASHEAQQTYQNSHASADDSSPQLND